MPTKKNATPANSKSLSVEPVSSESQYIEYTPLSKLLRAPRNPKDHDIGALAESMKRFGYVAPMLLNESSGRLVGGHGRLERLEQAKDSGEVPPKRIQVKGKEWLVPVVRGIAFESDEEAEAYLLADNRLVELGGWKDEELLPILKDLAEGAGLEGVGFDADDLDQMLLDAESGDVSPSEGDGEMLDSLGVTLGEPTMAVTGGNVFKVRGRHWLVVADVIKDPIKWVKYLDGCDWFCPFPGPLTYCSSVLDLKVICGVQPNLYIAGHILDHVVSVYGAKAIERMEDA
jgi:hypothetical protein